MTHFKISFLVCILLLSFTAFAQDQNEIFWNAAKANDTKKLKEMIAKGFDVNTRNHYGVTALTFAIDKGNLEAVNLLLENGADPNLKDSFYGETPFGWAFYRKNQAIIKTMIEHGADIKTEDAVINAYYNELPDIVIFILEKGAPGAEKVAGICIDAGNAELFARVFKFCKMDEAALSASLLKATKSKNEKIITILKEAGAKLPEIKNEPLAVKPDEKMKGIYATTDLSKVDIDIQDSSLAASFDGSPYYKLRLRKDNIFEFVDFPQVTLEFEKLDGKYISVTLNQGGNPAKFNRIESKEIASDKKAFTDEPGIKVEKPINWPSFRGNQANGIADGQNPPVIWDIKNAQNLRWKTFIPGLSHACPVIWNDKILIVTAQGADTTAEYRVGLFGDVEPANDSSAHIWKIYCLDKKSGKILWEKKAYEGVPRVKRHVKGTQANATPVTNGEYVVALFGSEGMVCYDFKGHEIWRKDLGVLDAGWFYNEETQWGPASSPIIYKNSVIVQCDRSKDSYIAAYDLKTGKELWKTMREEISSWGTPNIYYGKRNELITHATRYIRAYNPDNGQELWKLKPNSEITVSTPVIMDSLIYLTAGYPPVSPVYAIRAGGSGDISIADSLNSGAFVKWRTLKGGTYMPSPIAYKSYLYTLANNGVLTCYDAMTGERKYRETIKGGGAFTASLVAADDKLYCTSEENGVFVVKAGPEYELISNNPVNEICMATPAITDGLVFIRGQHHLFCIGRKK
ncbi:MAG: PQQ-binding-like beta-propeller repeat protein [Bacteroidales bacterium]